MLAAGLSAPAGFSRACFSRRVTLISPVGRGFSLLWLASTFFLVSAGVTVLFHLPVWRTLALAGCASSAAAILTWWRAVPPGARFGGLFDLAVILVFISPVGARLFPGL